MTQSTDPNDVCYYCGYSLKDHFNEPYLGQTDSRPDCRFGGVRAVICKYTNIKDKLAEINDTLRQVCDASKKLNPFWVRQEHPELVDTFDKLNKLKL